MDFNEVGITNRGYLYVSDVIVCQDTRPELKKD